MFHPRVIFFFGGDRWVKASTASEHAVPQRPRNTCEEIAFSSTSTSLVSCSLGSGSYLGADDALTGSVRVKLR